MFYHEYRNLDRWGPATTPEPPVVVSSPDGPRRGSKAGPRLRPLHGGAMFLEVNAGHERLTLVQLAEVYSPDGRFTVGQHIKKGDAP